MKRCKGYVSLKHIWQLFEGKKNFLFLLKSGTSKMLQNTFTKGFSLVRWIFLDSRRETHRLFQRRILKTLSPSLGFPWPSLFLHWLLAWAREFGGLGLILFLENILPWWPRNKIPFFRYEGYHGRTEFSEWSGESPEKFLLSRKPTGLEKFREGVKLSSVFIEAQMPTHVL